MILPINGQECVVAHRGNLHVGVVAKSYVNHLGQYRISVWSRSWGYDLDFKSRDVELIALEYGDGNVYNQEAARAAFMRKYSAAEQANMLNAEAGTMVSAPVVNKLTGRGRAPITPHTRTESVVRRVLRKS